MTRTQKILLLGVGVLAVYVVAFFVIVDRSQLPPLRASTILVFLIATAVQLGGIWLFGELFRQGLEAGDVEISTGQGFRAALVGATVARLLPIGGAVTPVAMSWAVRNRARNAEGAAIRATLLNYGALLVVTGVCLFFAAPDVEGWVAEIRLAATGVVVVGAVILVGSAYLGSLGDRLPRWLRSRIGDGMFNQSLDLRGHAFVWGRVLAEAAVLVLVLVAFDIELGLLQVFAAFGVSQIAAGIPGTPGGLGFAEAGMVGALAMFGIDPTVALTPVLVFRIVSYWVPAGAGLWAGTSTFLESARYRAAA